MSNATPSGLASMMRVVADSLDRMYDDVPYEPTDNFEVIVARMGTRDALRALSRLTEQVADRIDTNLPEEYQQP